MGVADVDEQNRRRYDRSRLRYPSDLTDEEWALVEPLIAPAKRGGNRRHVVVREVVNGLMYILSTGRQWRAIAKDLPPRSTLYDYFDLWGWDATLIASTTQCRQAASREANPTATIIDSQSVKSAEKGGLRLIRRATMQAKKIKGRKRHILVDTQGLLMHAIVHDQDRDGGALLMASLFGGFPSLIKLYADGGPEFQSAVKRILARVNVEIVKRPDQATGFVALPKCWIVERTFAWLGRYRRLAKDWECTWFR